MQCTLTESENRTLRVILVDDDDTDNLLHERVLRTSALVDHIETYERSEEALKRLLHDGVGFDLIFLDVNMPRMNGFQFLEELQAQNFSSSAGSLIVILSTSPQSNDIDQVKISWPNLKSIKKPLQTMHLEMLTEALIGSHLDPNQS